MPTITLIAAVADNRCIGSGNAMPWHIAEDFAFFKRYTLGKPVVPEIIIMGGAQIYAQALPLATDLRLTEVRLDIDGDAFFPAFAPAEWQEVERSSHTAAANGIRFDFVHYRRARQAS